MGRIIIWFKSLSQRIKTSCLVACSIIGFISTIMSIIGCSLNSWIKSIVCCFLVVLGSFLLIAAVTYISIGCIYKHTVSLTIRHTPVSIVRGDIFETDGFRVIGCDTCFDTRVDDVVISKKSLHGRFVLEHGNEEEIRDLVKQEAIKRGLNSNKDGLYTFPLGTVIKYVSSVDGQTYLMLAMTELDEKYEARIDMARFENMLMKMWSEINRVYASNDVVIPILGSGITRFIDGPKDKESLLRCMLCTLNGSGVTFNSQIMVVIDDNAQDIPLYEYKNMYNSRQWR